MFELFNEIDWTEYTDLFTYGDPPVYMQLIYFNAAVLVLVIISFLFAKEPQPKRTKLLLKITWFAINMAIVGQQQLGLDRYIESLFG